MVKVLKFIILLHIKCVGVTVVFYTLGRYNADPVPGDWGPTFVIHD